MGTKEGSKGGSSAAYHVDEEQAASDASESDILSMADSVKDGDLGGIMVWYASVMDADKQDIAFQYEATDDATKWSDSTGDDWASALSRMSS